MAAIFEMSLEIRPEGTLKYPVVSPNTWSTSIWSLTMRARWKWSPVMTSRKTLQGFILVHGAVAPVGDRMAGDVFTGFAVRDGQEFLAVQSWFEPAGGFEDFVFLAQGFEVLGHVAHGFAGAQHQEPARVEGEVQKVHDPFLQNRLEVDEEVAATDEVDIGEGRVLDEVVLSEDHHFANIAGDLEVVVLVVEIFGQEFGGQVGRDAGRVHPGPGAQDGVLVHVGGEDFHVQGFAQPLQALPITMAKV